MDKLCSIDFRVDLCNTFNFFVSISLFSTDPAVMVSESGKDVGRISQFVLFCF